MAKAIHSMIRVLDEARSVEFYEKAFGLRVKDRFPFDGFTLVYLRNESTDFELELTINHDRKEPYQLGDGYGHLALVVDDLRFIHIAITGRYAEPVVRAFPDRWTLVHGTAGTGARVYRRVR